MPNLKNLFIVITDSKIKVSYQEDKSLLSVPYAKISVLCNDENTEITTIQGEYKPSFVIAEQLKFIDNNLNFAKILHISGPTLLEGLKNDFYTRDNEFLTELFQDSIYPGEIVPSGLQKYYNSLIGGLALTYFSYKVMSKIKYYGPFKHDFPIDNFKFSDISNNLYHYNSYLLHFLNTIDYMHISKLWLKELEKTWKFFNNILPEGPEYNLNLAISNAIHSYAEYIKDKSSNVMTHYDNLNTNLESHKNKMEKLMLVVGTISTFSMQQMSEVYEKNMSNMAAYKDIYSQELLTELLNHKTQMNSKNEEGISKLENKYHELVVKLTQHQNNCADELTKTYQTFEKKLENQYVELRQQLCVYQDETQHKIDELNRKFSKLN